MAELRAKGGDGQGGGFFGGLPPGMMGGGGQNPQTAEEQAERQRKADEQRAAILKSILTASARERCEVPAFHAHASGWIAADSVPMHLAFAGSRAWSMSSGWCPRVCLLILDSIF